MPVVLYGCETWSLKLREEHGLRVFKNRVLRRIFGPKRDEGTEGWRKLHMSSATQLSGGVFLVVGIWIILDPTKTHLFHLTYTEDVAADLLQYLGYCLVAIGCVIFLVGFCGCCGSLYERRKCILFQYFVFLFLLLCAELSVAVATLIYREDFLTGLENRLLNRFRNLYGRDSSVFTQAIDQAQYTFNCCGILSDADYVNTKWRNESVGISNRSRINVPLTCCTLANPDGCLEDLEKWFKEDTTLLIGLGIGIAFFHGLGLGWILRNEQNNGIWTSDVAYEME
ncbi:hypothetical protein B7P43_G12883 [Cryptotermes secundus]|uniref:Uncharacterized protein n=1 Tax=Cryptotermes secundus TaxID=105785 RepID=A0A2J7PRP1_9NEOP|nr:hypothetical protein B7P43_G12883 [Cryptotermes secundus]